MSVVVNKRNFTGDPDGAMNFQATAPYSASSWVTVTPASFTLAPGATRIVSAAISVPANPEPGDHQVALVFLAPAGQSSANIRINRGIAIPAYITVPGPTTDTTSVTDLSAPGFVTGGSVTVAAHVNDSGTVHRDFRAATAVDMHAAGSALPFPDFTVMRDSTRDISTTWKPPLLCICHPSLTIHNADGTVSTESVRVIVFPVWTVAAIVCTLAILAVGGWLLRRRYRASVINAAAHLTRGTHARQS